MRISDWSSDVCSSDLRHHDVAAQSGDALDAGAKLRDAGRSVAEAKTRRCHRIQTVGVLRATIGNNRTGQRAGLRQLARSMWLGLIAILRLATLPGESIQWPAACSL